MSGEEPDLSLIESNALWAELASRFDQAVFIGYLRPVANGGEARLWDRWSGGASIELLGLTRWVGLRIESAVAATMFPTIE